MFSSFFASKKWALWAYLGLFLLLFFLYMQTSLNVAINSWYSDFYNVLQKPKIELLDSNTTQKAEEKFENNASLIQEANQKAQEISKKLILSIKAHFIIIKVYWNIFLILGL